MREVTIATIMLWLGQAAQGILNTVFSMQVLTPRYTARKTAVLFTLAQSPYILISYFLVNDRFANWVFAATYYTLMCRIFYSDSLKKILLSICGLYLLIFASSFAEFFTLQILSIPPSVVMGGMMEALANIGFCFFFAFGLWIMVCIKKRRKYDWSSKELMSVLAFSMIQLFLVEAVAYMIFLYLPASRDQMLPTLAVLAGTVLCVAADILLFRMLMERAQKEQLSVQLDVMKKQSQLELTYYTSVNEQIQEIRKIRHDFNNQLQTAYGVLAQGNQEDARVLLSQLEQRIAQSKPVYYCANPIVNAILWDKGKEAKAAGIDFQTDVRLPEQVGIEKIDLCSMFANLLDNGIHAAAACGEGRSVSVTAYERGGYCVVRVENSAREDGGQKAAKEEGHGYGLSILKTIAARYDGEFHTEQAGGLFRAVATLKLR